MSFDPFVILGIDKTASQSEILEAYKIKKKYYSDRLFDEGDAGANAARNLEKVEDAYQRAMEYSHENATVTGDPTNFDDIKRAIRDKNPELAQSLLDNISYRGAEWHYFQSIIFYEKHWMNESKKQLEIAIELEPSNPKYKKALDNLKKKIDGGRPFENQQNQNANFQNQGYYQNQNPYTQRTYSQNQNDMAGGCCAACQALWCADCCCECMGGDLIGCC